MTILLSILVIAFSAGFMTSTVMANNWVGEAKNKGGSVVDSLYTNLD